MMAFINNVENHQDVKKGGQKVLGKSGKTNVPSDQPGGWYWAFCDTGGGVALPDKSRVDFMYLLTCTKIKF